MSGTLSKQIDINDETRHFYEEYLCQKKYRIANVLRVVSLHKDYPRLVHRLSSANETRELQKDLLAALDEFLEKVTKAAYFQTLDDKQQTDFIDIAERVIPQIYIPLENYLPTLIDDSAENQGISIDYFNEEHFHYLENKSRSGEEKGVSGFVTKAEYVNNELVSEDMRRRAAVPKVCRIILDGYTQKQELIDYIDEHWEEISSTISSVYGQSKKRRTASKTFLRDVDIYNKYHEFKAERLSDPEVRVYGWLLNQSFYKEDKEPDTIRKIVAEIQTQIDEINN